MATQHDAISKCIHTFCTIWCKYSYLRDKRKTFLASKKRAPFLEGFLKRKSFRAGDLAQWFKRLAGKHKVVSLFPDTIKEEKKKEVIYSALGHYCHSPISLDTSGFCFCLCLSPPTFSAIPGL